MDVSSPDSRIGATVTSPNRNYIFIGALSETKEMDDTIRGVLAHEICHYVMKLIFENGNLPFFKNDKEKSEEFGEICLKIEEMIRGPNGNYIDDSCDMIISGVWENYNKTGNLPPNSDIFKLELIVRVPQIYAKYANDHAKIKELEALYNLLFEFYKSNILPEIQKFSSESREAIRSVNERSGILPIIKNSNYEFCQLDNDNFTIHEQFTVIQTNVPAFYLVNVFKNLDKSCKTILDIQNIFLSSKILQKLGLFKDFMNIAKQNSQLSVYIDCSESFDSKIIEIIKNGSHKFIFIVSDINICYKIKELLNHENYSSNIQKLTFQWHNLTTKTQKELCKHKIMFQDGSMTTISEVIFNESNQTLQLDDARLQELSEVIDENLLSLLAGKSQISINESSNDIKIDKNFQFLFQQRTFLKFSSTITKLMQDELMRDTENMNYILISDIAGTGKSWALKSIQNLYKTKWTTFIDLKEFIKVFKFIKSSINFQTFMTDFVLKDKPSYEVKIFLKLYKIGKVCIFCDGFDEIAPDCADYVLNLFKCFDFNDGNQLWITTRDHFEVSLKDELKLDTVYKLNQFTEKECIDLVAVTWILDDKTRNEDTNYKTDPDKMENYKEKAKNLSEKVIGIKTTSIGLPQFYKMIAEVFMKEKEVKQNVSILFIYTEYIKIQIERWTHQGGTIRTNESIESLRKVLSHQEVHQLIALQSIFPKNSNFSDQNLDDYKWNEREILGCGFLYKKDGSYLFVHETFREYYAADYIIKAIDENIEDNIIYETFMQFMTVKKFGIIRVFLNEALSKSIQSETERRNLTKLVEYLSKNSEKLKNLADIFERNLIHLSNLLMDVIEFGSYKEYLAIFDNNKELISLIIEQEEIFNKLSNIILHKFDQNHLEIFIMDQKIIFKIIKSNLSVKSIKDFIGKLFKTLKNESKRKVLKLSDNSSKNLFYYLIKTKFEFSEKLDLILELLRQNLSKEEILELMKSLNNLNQNIFHICMDSNDEKKLKCLWKKIEEFLSDQNEFKDFLTQPTSKQQETPILLAAKSTDINFHESLWNLLIETFQNLDDLFHLLTQVNKNNYNFIHNVVFHTNTKIIEFTLIKLKETFSKSKYQSILKSKGESDRNLLLCAASSSKDVNCHQILWTTMKDSCSNDKEFIDIIKEVDSNFENFFQLAVNSSTADVVEFMEQQLSANLSKDEIRSLLKSCNKWKRHFLSIAANHENSLDVHEEFWIILKKYFNFSEILEFIKYIDALGNNFMIDLVRSSSKEVVDLTWIKIKKVLSSISEDQNENLKYCDKIIQKVIKSIKIDEEEIGLLKFNWVISENPNFLDDGASLIRKQILTIKCLSNLMLFASDENIENHKVLWSHLLENYKTSENLKKLLMEQETTGDTYLHILLIFNKTKIIKFTLEKMKENLNESDFHDVLTIKKFKGRGMLYQAVISSKQVETHQILWKYFTESCKSTEEFLTFANEIDEDDVCVINLVVVSSTVEIFNFMVAELEKLVSSNKIRQIFQKLNRWNLNMLQSAVNESESLELHESLWTVIQNHFKPQEILDFIKHISSYGYNLLMTIIDTKNNEIIEFSWMKVKEVFATIGSVNEEQIKQLDGVFKKVQKSMNLEDHEVNLLQLEWLKTEESCNLFQDSQKLISDIKSLKNLFSFVAYIDVKKHEFLWTNLLEAFENREDLTKLLITRLSNGNTYIHSLVTKSCAEIIDFTFNKILENFNESQIHRILLSKGIDERLLVHNSIIYTKELQNHHALMRFLTKSSINLLNIFQEVDEDGNNVFNLATMLSTNEILNLYMQELEKTATHDEIKQILRNLSKRNQNLLQSANGMNKSLKFHESLWLIIHKYFSLTEILDFIKHIDSFKATALIHAVCENVSEVIEFTWNKIKFVLKGTGCANVDDDKNIEKCNRIIQLKKAQRSNDLSIDESEYLTMNWIKNANVKVFNDKIEFIQTERANIKSINELMAFVAVEDVKSHEILWSHLLKTFKNSEDLRKLMMERNEGGSNYIHHLVNYNKSNIIEFTLEKLAQNLSLSNFHLIIKIKAHNNKSLLHVAATSSKHLEVIQILWTTLKKSFQNVDEFLDFVSESDINGDNLLMLAASYSSAEVFAFLEQEFTKIIAPEKVKFMLKMTNKFKQNFLQSAAIENESLKLHETLWIITHKYFNNFEILELLTHLDVYKYNFLLSIIEERKFEIKNFSIFKVREALDQIPCESEEQAKNIERFNFIATKVIKIIELEDDENEFLKFQWIKHENQTLESNLEKKLNVDCLMDLMEFISNNNVDQHENLYTYLTQKFKNRANLMKLMLETKNSGDNFIHLLVAHNSAEIIEFTFYKLKNLLRHSQYHEILTTKGELGRNLLQVATVSTKDVKVHQVLWKIYQQSCSSTEEFLQILEEHAPNDSNAFNLAIINSSGEVLEFFCEELDKLSCTCKVREFLRSLNDEKQNTMQLAAYYSKSLEFHQKYWKIIKKYFGSSFILDFINHCDEDGYHVLHTAVLENTKKVTEFIWTQIKEFITDENEQAEYLQREVYDGDNIYQISRTNTTDDDLDDDISCWVSDLMEYYEFIFVNLE